jgi:protease-4
MIKERYYLEMNLRGSIVERGSPFTGSHSLLGLLRMIKEAGDDPKFAGIAINASGLQAEGEVLWELMEALKEFKSHGKKVVMYIDMASFASYAFATAADRIVLDPEGFIEMSGVVVARGYFKGSLEKLGIGFQEIRLFTYKTAAETFSRDSLSDADREQYGTYIADLYQTIKQQVTEGRRITGDDFDRLIDEGFLFHARQSKERGLVDALGRWEDVKNIVKELEGSEKAFLPYRLPFQDGVAEMMGSALGEAGIKAPAPDRWGEPPTIALVYAIGGTSMDSGMSARKLSRDIEAAGKDQSVKAIVIRVDSPGGQAVAADYVAQSMKTAKKSKPLIVSQGSVAGSGGYWVSMFGDSIFSSPITLTGSIGVIADWFYDNGLNEKLGASTDFVQIGKHADLQAGLLFPHRDLTAEERGRYEEFILAVYKDFVEKVAQGRQKSTEEIEAIAQGRVWSGLKAKEIGLIDEIGNLEAAIAAAREKAKISPSEEIQIRELPRTDFLSFLSTAGARLVGAGGSPWGLPMPSDLSPREQRAREYLLFRLKHNGEPLPILPAESLSLF